MNLEGPPFAVAMFSLYLKYNTYYEINRMSGHKVHAVPHISPNTDLAKMNIIKT
jgi:hypothetical protein